MLPLLAVPATTKVYQAAKATIAPAGQEAGTGVYIACGVILALILAAYWFVPWWREHRKWVKTVAAFNALVNEPIRQFLIMYGADVSKFDEDMDNFMVAIYKNHKALKAYSAVIADVFAAVSQAAAIQIRYGGNFLEENQQSAGVRSDKRILH